MKAVVEHGSWSQKLLGLHCLSLPGSQITLHVTSLPCSWGLVPTPHMRSHTHSHRPRGLEDTPFRTCALPCCALVRRLDPDHLSTPPQNVASFTLARDEAGNVLLEDGKGRCPFDPNFKSTALVVGKWEHSLGAFVLHERYTGQEDRIRGVSGLWAVWVPEVRWCPHAVLVPRGHRVTLGCPLPSPCFRLGRMDGAAVTLGPEQGMGTGPREPFPWERSLGRRRAVHWNSQ